MRHHCLVLIHLRVQVPLSCKVATCDAWPIDYTCYTPYTLNISQLRYAQLPFVYRPWLLSLCQILYRFKLDQ